MVGVPQCVRVLRQAMLQGALRQDVGILTVVIRLGHDRDAAGSHDGRAMLNLKGLSIFLQCSSEPPGSPLHPQDPCAGMYFDLC